MLGQNVAPAVFSVSTNTNYSSSDDNGFRPNPGAEVSFQWSSPPWAVARVGADAAPGKSPLESRRFATLDEYQAGSRQDQHSVLVDYDIFVRVPRLDAKDLLRVQQLYKAEDLDFRRGRARQQLTGAWNSPTSPTGLPGARPISACSRSGRRRRSTVRAGKAAAHVTRGNGPPATAESSS